jgi:hypothetical protein
LRRTLKHRPDLLEKANLDDADQKMLKKIIDEERSDEV